MKLKVICCGCGKVLKPGSVKPVSHGFCRVCELEAYLLAGMLKPDELAELVRLCEEGG